MVLWLIVQITFRLIDKAKFYEYDPASEKIFLPVPTRTWVWKRYRMDIKGQTGKGAPLRLRAFLSMWRSFFFIDFLIMY